MAQLTGTHLLDSGGASLDTEDYVYDLAGQRTQQVFTAGNFMNYTYDNIGELQTATGLEPGGVTSRLHEQFGYTYDAAGNLDFRTNNALLQTHTVNNLNELARVTRSGVLTVNGITTSPATNVTVNGSNAVIYVDNTFASPNQPFGGTITNTFTAISQDSYGRSDSNSVTAILPASDNMDYDLNGNLLRDKSPAGGTNRVFAYDDENQLTAVWVTNAWMSQFTYDGQNRRRIRKECTWNGSAWLQTNEVHYIYDGSVVIQERDQNNLPEVTYTRGGGLLARTANPSILDPRLSSFASAFYHAGGNGNITCLIYSNQTIAAKYSYDPYGNALSKIGSLADVNSYRFSSQEYHSPSGLIIYLRRFYDPNLQRWINRDPIHERGGINLYGYVQNNPVSKVDPLGHGPEMIGEWVEENGPELEELAEEAEVGLETIWDKVVDFFANDGNQCLVNQMVGQAGEFHLETLVDGPLESQVQFELEDGSIRILDFVNWEAATGYEVKVGYLDMSPEIQMQIQRAAQIMQSSFSGIDGIEYHFLTSPITGQIGASPSVIQALKDGGFLIVYHP